MSTPRYHRDPTIYYLYQILEELSSGSIRVPRFQRPFVWTDEQRVELLRSVYQGIPIGSILVWRTELKISAHDRIGPCAIPGETPGQGSFLLDGLQRLSTLMSSLQAPPKDADSSELPTTWTDDEGRQWIIYFDLDKQDFHIPRSDGDIRPTWVPLYIALDNMTVLQWQQERLGSIPSEVLSRASSLSRAFGAYKIPLIPIVTDDIDQATLIFQRINSQGTSMSHVHMANALSWSENFDLLETIETARDALDEIGWTGISHELVFRTARLILGFEAYGKNQDKVSQALKKDPSWLDKATKSLGWAAEFLRDECMIGSVEMLPYNMQLVVLAAAFHDASVTRPNLEYRHRLRDWFWVTTYAQAFLGESRVRQYVEQARKILQGRSPGPWRKKGDMRLSSLPTVPDPHGVRGIALKIRLAELAPLDIGGKPIDTRTLLARRGRAGLPRLLTDVSPAKVLKKGQPQKPLPVSCAGNLVLAEGVSLERMRHDLLDEKVRLSPKFLESHAISPEAVSALRGGDTQRFLRLRFARLDMIEQDFFRETWSIYEELSKTEEEF